jgi:hypothetical protein
MRMPQQELIPAPIDGKMIPDRNKVFLAGQAAVTANTFEQCRRGARPN